MFHEGNCTGIVHEEIEFSKRLLDSSRPLYVEGGYGAHWLGMQARKCISTMHAIV